MTVTKRKAKPITAHPLFPIVTSLWFAAFLSLGSFAVAPQLLEGPVVALGIPDILPAAQPPLGFTVRALLALVMLGVGGMAGFLVGKALARGKADAPVRARSFGRNSAEAAPNADVSVAAPEASSARRTSHRRPLNPLEDLGEPMGASFTGETYEPVDPQALEGFDDAHGFVANTSDANDSSENMAENEAMRMPWDEADEAAGAETTRLALQPVHGQFEDPLALDLLLADAEVLSNGPQHEYEQAAEGPVFSQSSAWGGGHDDLSEARSDEPFAPSGNVAAAHSPDVLETEIATPQEKPASVPLMKAPLLQAPASAPTPLSRTPLDDLGLVQLTERLALAIGRLHQAQAEGSNANVHHAFAQAEKPVESAEAEVAEEPAGLAGVAQADPPYSSFTVVQPQAVPAIARFEVSKAAELGSADLGHKNERVVQLRPAALRPYAPETEAFEDEAPGFERFLRVPETNPVTELAPAEFSASEADDEQVGEDSYDADYETVDDDDDDADDDAGDVWVGAGAEPDVAEARYPSLLDMGASSLRRKTLHAPLEEGVDADTDDDGSLDDGFEPAVVFPGQVAAQPSINDTKPRLFERPASASGMPDLIIPMPGSPLAAPGRAAPSSPLDMLDGPEDLQGMPHDIAAGPAVDAEEADRALRAALATLQRMTAQG